MIPIYLFINYNYLLNVKKIYIFRFSDNSKSYQVLKMSSLEKSIRQRLTKQARLKRRRTKSSDFDSSSCGYGKDEDSLWFDPGRQLEEKSDKMSKEKQKFFRHSAFNKGSKNKLTTDLTDENKSKAKEQAWGFAAAAAGGIATGPFSLSVRDSGSSNDTAQPCTSTNDSYEKYKSGFGRLKGLFDGLSHLFAAPSHARMRPGTFSNYSLSKRKPKNPDEKTLETDKETITIDENVSPSMTPSRLFKTAVSSKQHEQERRRIISGDLFNSGTRMEEIKMKKRHIIAEATATQQHHRGTNSGKTNIAWPRVRLCVWVAGWLAKALF